MTTRRRSASRSTSSAQSSEEPVKPWHSTKVGDPLPRSDQARSASFTWTVCVSEVRVMPSV